MALRPAWEAELRKKGQAARAQLIYKADHPQQTAQRQPLTYVPDQPAQPQMQPVSTASVMQMPSSFNAPETPSIAQVNAKTGSITMPVKVNNGFQQPHTLPGMVNIKPQTFPTNHVGPVDAAVNFYKQFAKGAQDAVAYDAGQPVPSTGSKAADKTARFIGNAVAGLTTGQTEMQALGAVGRGVESVAAKVAPGLVSRLAGNAAEGGTQGAVGGAMMGQTNAKDVATNAAAGATFGLGAHVIGKAAKAVADRTGLTSKLESFVTRHRSVSPELETATREMMQTPTQPRKLGIATGPLKNASNESYINKVMSDIKPIVTERMTPPLENPNELAKWLQPHLDTSLNQIRKLHYNDMVELANEVKSHMSMYDVAKTVAKEKGYNLDRILNNQVPSIKQTADRLRMGRVAGAVEPPNTNVRVAVSPEYTPTVKPTEAVPAEAPAPAMKGNWFTNLFGNRGLGIAATGSLRVPGKSLTSEGSIVSTRIKTDRQGLIQDAAAKARAVHQNMVDMLSPFRKVSNDAYETAMDASRSNNLANNISGKDFVTPEGVRVGDGLSSIFKKVARGHDKTFLDYLIKRDAIDRVGRNERVYDEKIKVPNPDNPKELVPLNNADVLTKVVAQMEKKYPEFKQLGKEWNTFTDNLLTHYGVDMGLINESQKAAMQELRPNYIKMMRQFLRSEKPARGFLAKTNNAFSGQKAPIKSVSPTGSARDIVDPRKTMIEAIGAWVNNGMRNRAMQEVYKEVRKNPEIFKGVIEIVHDHKTSAAEINKILAEDGIAGLSEKLNTEYDSVFKKGNNDNVVTVMVDGNPIKMRVHDPELIKAMMGLGPQASNLLVDILSMFSNATKRGATGVLAPYFAVKGATMDLVSSAIQSRNPAKQAAYTVYSILSGVGDKLNVPGLRDWAQEYRFAGGEYSAALRGDRKLNKSVSRMTRYPLLSPQNIAKVTKNTVAAPFHALESLGNIMENAPRIAASKIERQHLGNSLTPKAVRQAMSAGREATVNYSRKGALSRDFEAVAPYNNAAIQGMYRVFSGLKRHPIRTVAAIGGLAVLPKLYEYAQFANDPDYQKLPARERYRNLIISKNADGTFVKIPMEPAYNTIGEITIEALRRFKDGNPEAFKGMQDAIANAMTPPLVTGALQGVTQGTGPEGSFEGLANATSLAPFSAVISNRSFTGAPIVSQRLAGNSPSQQYDEKTSDPAKWIGQKIGMSPLKVDYLIRAYGGDASRLILPLMSDVGAGTPRNTMLKNFIVDPVFTNTLSNDFYTMKTKITNAESDNRTNAVPLPKWYNPHIAAYVTSQRKGGISKQLSILSNQKRGIQSDKTLNAQQKSDKLREIQAQMNDIYLEAVTKMKAAGIS